MFSIKTRSLRNRGFLLDFGIVNCNSIPCLNVNVNFSGWYELGIVTREKFLDWVHICVEVDMVNATLRAAVNGDVLKTVHNVPGLNPPHSKLNMRLGVVQDSFDRAPTQTWSLRISMEKNFCSANFFGHLSLTNILREHLLMK